MTLSERQRISLLGLLLAATLAVAAVSGIEKDGEANAESREGAGSAVSRAAGGPESSSGKLAKLDLSQIKREAVEPVEVDIFMAKSWQPAPPPPAAAQSAAPVIPTAPPLPFAYAGSLGDPQTGKVTVYLTRGDSVYTVSVGDMIEEQYRLEAVGDNQLTFVYLPLKTQQTLAIPGK